MKCQGETDGRQAAAHAAKHVRGIIGKRRRSRDPGRLNAGATNATRCFLQNLRYALRSYEKTPALTLAILSTLALAIGTSTAIFSIDRITCATG